MKVGRSNRTGRPRVRRTGFAADETGSATLLTAVTLIVAIGIAAISMDGGNYFYLRRVQQSATDIAAVSAASNIANATALASTSSQTNGFAPSSITSVEVGTYTYDPSVAPSQRFVSSGATSNAVRVTLATRPPFIFGGLLNTLVAGEHANQQSGFLVRTRAVATNQDVAAFSLGTGLAQLNGGVENAVLGALLGSQLSLSVMDWQALASANIDLFAFASALNTRAQLQAATFGSVASATVSRTNALQALGDALAAAGASGPATSAFASVLAGASLGNAYLPVSTLLSFGPFGDTTLSSTGPLAAKVSALDLLSGLLQVANGQSEVKTDISLGIPGIASAHLNLVIGQLPRSTSLLAVGATGTTLRSAQTRVFLTIRVVGSGPIPFVDLPLYVELAPGLAQLSAIACTNTADQATLSVKPGVVNAWIGLVSDADLSTLTSAPVASPATLVNLLGVAQVTGRANATLANTNAVAVGFAQSDIAALTRKTTSTTDFTASLYTSLLNNLVLNVAILGTGLGTPTGLDTGVKQVLSGAATPVDLGVNAILSSLGVTLGNATTWVSGVKCGRATLVN